MNLARTGSGQIWKTGILRIPTCVMLESEPLKQFAVVYICVTAEWEDGWRVSIVDKDKPFLKALSRTGRMYLTNRFPFSVDREVAFINLVY